MYIVNVLYGVLLEYDLCDFSYTVLERLEQDEFQPLRIVSLMKLQSKFYFNLVDSWEVFEFDLNTKQIIAYGESLEEKKGQIIVKRSFYYNNEIWIIPYSIDDKIRIFNSNSKKIREIESIKNIAEKKGYTLNTEHCLSNILQKENILWTAIYRTAYIIALDMETKQLQIFSIGEDKKIESINYCEDEFWLSFYNTNLVASWKINYGIEEEYFAKPIQAINGEALRFVYVTEKKIYGIPVRDNKICVIDKETGDSLSFEYPSDFRRTYNEQRCMFYDFVVHEDKLILLPYSVNYFIVLDLISVKAEFYECRFERSDVMAYYIENRLIRDGLVESSSFHLLDFINYFQNREEFYFEVAPYEKVGRKIMENIKKK